MPFSNLIEAINGKPVRDFAALVNVPETHEFEDRVMLTASRSVLAAASDTSPRSGGLSLQVEAIGSKLWRHRTNVQRLGPDYNLSDQGIAQSVWFSESGLVKFPARSGRLREQCPRDVLTLR